jgi:acyl carrier protein
MWDNQFEELLRSFLPYLSASEPLTEDTALRDLGLDSMAAVELLSSVEDLYGARLDDDALTLATFETPGTLWNAVATIRT